MPGKCVRLALLMACAAFGQADPCELDAVTRWNRFAETAKRYTDLRTAGVRSLKERERMRREFDAVMSCECF